MKKTTQNLLVPDQKCLLVSDDLIVVPHDKNSPPSWAPVWLYRYSAIVDRELFDQLKARRYEKPCDICPENIKSICKSENKF